MCIERSTPGSVSNISGSSLRSSPIAPISVRSVPREMCTPRPCERIRASTAAISASPASGCMTMIMVVLLANGWAQSNSGDPFGAARIVEICLLLVKSTVAWGPPESLSGNKRNTRTAARYAAALASERTSRSWIQSSTSPSALASVFLSPAVDFAVDSLGHVSPQQFADMLVDRRDEVGACPVHDRLQPLAQLRPQARVGEKVDALQDLHADFLGHRLPMRGIGSGGGRAGGGAGGSVSGGAGALGRVR